MYIYIYKNGITRTLAHHHKFRKKFLQGDSPAPNSFSLILFFFLRQILRKGMNLAISNFDSGKV